jgi:hypothetical protein
MLGVVAKGAGAGVGVVEYQGGDEDGNEEGP